MSKLGKGVIFLSTGKLKINIGELNVELEGDNDLLYRSFSDIRTDGSFRSGSKPTVRSIDERLNRKAEPKLETITAEAVNNEAEPQTDEITVTAAIAESSDTVKTPISQDLPDINTLILEKKKMATSAWMLIMAWSASHKGKIEFTKKQLRKIYNNSSKHVGLRSKDFISNFMLLLLNDYIVMTGKNTFELTDNGYEQAYSLLTESENTDSMNIAI